MTGHRLATTLLFARVVFVSLALVALGAGGARGATPGSVVVLPTTGIVDQVMEGYISSGITNAARDGAAAVVIELDTPGGSLNSMRAIVESELEAPLPVIVWVSPSGARAASAGTFITLAANIVAMESGTNIGAATPVDQNGNAITGPEGQKVTNDAIALMTAICQTRGRPVDWAVATITDATSYTVDQAIAAGAADIRSDSLPDLLSQVNGRTVQVGGHPVVLQTAGAETSTVGMTFLQDLLHVASDPNIAFILFTIGFYGLLFELAHPNLVTGILGAFAIILAFIGFGSLPLNLAGLLLVALAIVLFVVDLTVTSHGLLTVAGLVAFVLGAAALYSSPGTPAAPAVGVAWPVIAVMTGFTALIVLGVVRVAWRTRRMPNVNIGIAGTGQLLPSGTEGVVRRPLAPLGTVYAAGEEWTARSSGGDVIDRGTTIEVVGQDGLLLLVAPQTRVAPLADLGTAHR